MFLCFGPMHFVDSFSSEVAVVPEPRESILVAHRFLAGVLFPTDVRRGSEDTGTFLASREVFSHEGTDIEAHAVVDIWLLTDGLFLDRLPAYKKIEGQLACEDGFESLL